MSAYPAFLDLGPFDRAAGIVRLPGSKSISNRILLLAALAEGRTQIHNLLASDDVDRMVEALGLLGVKITGSRQDVVAVEGCNGGFPVKQADLFLGNAGTAFRPLTAALAMCGGHYKLSGVARMHERPIGDLVDALRSLGADIRYLGQRRLPAAGNQARNDTRWLEGPDTRRRVQPVSHRVAHGAAACRQADHHRGGG